MKNSFFTWGKKTQKKLPESKDGTTTTEKINALRKLVDSGKLNTANRKKYQKLLDQFLELRDKANAKKAAAKSSSIDDDDENDMARKIMSEESKVAKVKAKAVEVAKKKAEERHKIITTKIKAMHPKPVKKFACGNESALMLLENGELYQWRDDNPLPVLMNDMFVKKYDHNSLVAKLNARRFYWTFEELIALDRRAIEKIKNEMKIVIHNRGDIILRLTGLITKGTMPKKYSKLTVQDLETKKKSDLETLANELGLLDSVSIQYIVRAIISKRANATTLITDVSAGAFHFVAATNLNALPLWSWGKNDFGQLGLGDNDDREQPTPITAMNSKVESVSCGDNFTICVTKLGTVYTWGRGENGQLGHTVILDNDEEEDEGVKKTKLQLSVDDISIPRRMELTSEIGEKLRFEGEAVDNANPSLNIAAGGSMSAAWTTRWEVEDELNHYDRKALEDLKLELEEKFRQLETSESVYKELVKRFGEPRACDEYAELVTCFTEIADMKDNEPCCFYRGEKHYTEEKCMKCYGRGYHRDKKLDAIDTLIDKSNEIVLQRRNELQSAKNAINGVKSTLKLLLKELRENKSEKSNLEQVQNTLMKELATVKSGNVKANIAGGSGKEEMLDRIHNEIYSLGESMNRIQHQEEMIDREAHKTHGRLLGMKVSLIKIQKQFHHETSKLLLYKRLKLRRQKRLKWNMILLRDNHARRLIEKAHSIWKKIERTEVAYLFTNSEEMTKLLEEHGKKSNDELETAWLIELSNQKLRQLMIVATNEMAREKTASWRFEKHIILGDVVTGWNEYDSKGRPVLYARYEIDSGRQNNGVSREQPFYCHAFQHNECDLPCPYKHVHEIMPMHVRQKALRRQGFKGGDVDCVEPGENTITLDKPTLLLSFFKYEEEDQGTIQKIRVYVDGNGTGEGIQQIYGVAYSQMNEFPGKIIPSGISIPVDIKSGQEPGWIDCPFANPVSLPVTDRQNIDDDINSVDGGVWIGIYAPHGAGIIRLYGHDLKGTSNKLVLRKNLKVVDNYLLTSPPIQFPQHEIIKFRPSLYCETAGLWARLLQILLDVAKLRQRLNQLLLSITHTEIEAKQLKVGQ
jgi:hypothetical protein